MDHQSRYKYLRRRFNNSAKQATLHKVFREVYVRVVCEDLDGKDVI
jgi:hypothetical protein